MAGKKKAKAKKKPSELERIYNIRKANHEDLEDFANFIINNSGNFNGTSLVAEAKAYLK